MVENGHGRGVGYSAGGSVVPGIELLTFAQLRGMAVGARGWEVLRVDFHVVAFGVRGRGALTVDFVRHDFGAGQVAWVRPGWTHRWDNIADVGGVLVLFRPELLAERSAAPRPPGLAAPVAQATPLVRDAVEHLRREYFAEPSPETGVILGNLLEVLMLRVGAGTGPAGDRVVFDAFAAAVEAHFARTRELAWYARKLGYSVRTVTRATGEVMGVGAKKFIDDRVILEAKRLLAHTDISAAECARHVGFDDATNFAKFFRARVGTSPGRFAKDVRTHP